MNDVVPFRLADTLLLPVEGVLPQPYEGPDIKLGQPQLFVQLTPQASLDGLARRDSTARRDPEGISAPHRADSHEEHLGRRGDDDGTNRIPQFHRIGIGFHE